MGKKLGGSMAGERERERESKGRREAPTIMAIITLKFRFYY